MSLPLISVIASKHMRVKLENNSGKIIGMKGTSLKIKMDTGEMVLFHPQDGILYTENGDKKVSIPIQKELFQNAS